MEKQFPGGVEILRKEIPLPLLSERERERGGGGVQANCYTKSLKKCFFRSLEEGFFQFLEEGFFRFLEEGFFRFLEESYSFCNLGSNPLQENGHSKHRDASLSAISHNFCLSL